MTAMTSEEIKGLKKGDIIIYTNEKNGTTSTWVVDYPQSVNNAKQKLTISETPPIEDEENEIQPKPARRVSVPTVAGGGDCEGKSGCVRVSTEVPNGRGNKRFSLLIKDFTNWSKKTDSEDGGSGETGSTGQTGSSGGSGDTGTTGESGGTGDTGSTGDTGDSGAAAAAAMMSVDIKSKKIKNEPVVLTDLLPTANQLDVDLNTIIILTFSNNIKAGTGTIVINNLENDDIQNIDITSSNITFENNTVTITPLRELKSKNTYQITVSSSAIKDMHNVDIDVFGNNIYQFTTK